MFQISEIYYGKLKGLRIFNETSGSFLNICLRGAIATAFAPSQQVNILDGFKTEEEILSGDGARSWIMAPFSNRLYHNSYSFNGKMYSIPSPAIHGLVHNKIFNVTNIELTSDFATITLEYNGFCKDTFPEYPFPLRIVVYYKIMLNKLSVTITGINAGSSPLPFACGWHPYFFLPDVPPDKCCLSVPSVTIVKTNENLLPIEGDYKEDISKQSGKDFSPLMPESGRILGKHTVNYCYIDLMESNNKIVTELSDPESNRKITLSQNRGVVYVYTGDGLSLRPRQSVALEPVEFITNVFNREEFSSEIIIQPGKQRTFNAEVHYTI